MQQSSLNLQEAALESQLNSSISSAVAGVQQAVTALSTKSLGDADYALFKQHYKTAQEVWLNAYDQACLSYRESKLNQVTFQKAYEVQIRNIMNNSELEDFFNPEATSNYQSIIAVFRKWDTSRR